ncbi:ACT domain-containing protein [Streptococcus marimammalium]|uniref:ACT domain-containing protein n=1 Tax=Streptococcus marimammalium TaxID=269666 RepID=UPI0003670630|nr:ACT domain-containing protein [Streptococcus marimammalium]
MKAIVTVIGKDRTGIVAKVATKIADLDLNIDDISQTVLDEFFTMMMVVSSPHQLDFDRLRRELSEYGKEINVSIKIQSTTIFESMHRL